MKSIIVDEKSKKVLWVMLVATLITKPFGLYPILPSVLKALYGMAMWYCVFMIPYSYLRHNDFLHPAKIMLKWIFLYSIIMIMMSILSNERDMDAFGNRYVTLFFNEYCAPLFIPPLFVLLACKKDNVRLLMRLSMLYVGLGLISLVFLGSFVVYISLFIIVFYAYQNKWKKILIVITCMTALMAFFQGGRMWIIVVGYSLISYVLTVRGNNHRLATIVCVTSLLLPFIMFVPMMMNSGDNYFIMFQDYVAEKIGNQEIGTDTRTFLYQEMSSDIFEDMSWLWGKGAYAHYYSSYFDQGGLSRFGRISSEVPFLNMMLHGGLLYTVPYFALIAYAVINAVSKGNNKFVKSIALIAAGFFFNSFIGDLTGCSFYQCGFFLLLGCCLSKSWLEMTDEEVYNLLTNRSN